MYPAKRDQLRVSFGFCINTLKMLTTSPLTLLRSARSRSSAVRVEKSRNGIRCFLAVTSAPPSWLWLRFNPQSRFSPADRFGLSPHAMCDFGHQPEFRFLGRFRNRIAFPDRAETALGGQRQFFARKIFAR